MGISKNPEKFFIATHNAMTNAQVAQAETEHVRDNINSILGEAVEEATDNADYYRNQAQEHAGVANNYATAAESAADLANLASQSISEYNYATCALMNADLTPASGKVALVYKDAIIAGKNNYTITTNCVSGDTVVFNGVTFTAVSSGASGNQFNVGATTTETAANLSATMNNNSTIKAIYTANYSSNIITIIEKVAGNGNTPGAMSKTGTITITAGSVVVSTSNGIWIKQGATGTGNWAKSSFIPIIIDGTIGTPKLAKNAVTYDKTSFLKRGKNIFNKLKASAQGYFVNYLTNAIEAYPANPNIANYHYTEYMSVLPSTTYIATKQPHTAVFYDESFNYLSGYVFTGSRQVTTPANCSYMVINFYHADIDILQIEIGTTSTYFEEYQLNITELKTNAAIAEISGILEPYKNENIALTTAEFISDRAQIGTFNGWAYPFNKSDVAALMDKIYGLKFYACIGSSTNIPAKLVVLNNSKSVLLSQDITILSTGYVELDMIVDLFKLTDTFYIGITTTNGVILVPPNCTTIYDNHNVKHAYTINGGTTWVDVATITTYSGLVELIGKPVYDFNKIADDKIKLSLPDKFDLVVGDSFELFYKGILSAINPYNYNIRITCDKGNAYAKRYIYTPLSGDIGTHVMTISVYDDQEVLHDSKTVNLIVKAKAANPATTKNVLCVGDSLTRGGEWVSEFCRRLTGIGGIPSGDGLTNVHFIGSVDGTSGAKFVGYGGWKYYYYNGAGFAHNYWITVTSGMKTGAESSQSIWQDSNGKQWILETIDSINSKLEFKQSLGASNVMPASGTLTYVSGGGDTTAIVYNLATESPSNPFYIGGSIDFAAYAASIGVSGIDYCYILLGWNSTTDTESKVKTDCRTFINNLRTSYPSCKITLMGLEVPAIDGLGTNYGTSWNYYEKLKVVFNFNKWYKEVAAEFTNVEFLNIAGQFDTENNMQTATRAVNSRNSNTETYINNGVHPANSGYMQIADAAYRNLTGKLI